MSKKRDCRSINIEIWKRMTPSEKYKTCKKCTKQCDLIKLLKSMKKIWQSENNIFNANKLELIKEV